MSRSRREMRRSSHGASVRRRRREFRSSSSVRHLAAAAEWRRPRLGRIPDRQARRRKRAAGAASALLQITPEERVSRTPGLPRQLRRIAGVGSVSVSPARPSGSRPGEPKEAVESFGSVRTSAAIRRGRTSLRRVRAAAMAAASAHLAGGMAGASAGMRRERTSLRPVRGVATVETSAHPVAISVADPAPARMSLRRPLVDATVGASARRRLLVDAMVAASALHPLLVVATVEASARRRLLVDAMVAASALHPLLVVATAAASARREGDLAVAGPVRLGAAAVVSAPLEVAAAVAVSARLAAVGAALLEVAVVAVARPAAVAAEEAGAAADKVSSHRPGPDSAGTGPLFVTYLQVDIIFVIESSAER
jgi:hypothetical protein